jgi:hypothetical protein
LRRSYKGDFKLAQSNEALSEYECFRGSTAEECEILDVYRRVGILIRFDRSRMLALVNDVAVARIAPADSERRSSHG